jgi:hypothetical protein
MISVMVIPSAVENYAASFDAGRMSGHRPIRVDPATEQVISHGSFGKYAGAAGQGAAPAGLVQKSWSKETSPVMPTW